MIIAFIGSQSTGKTTLLRAMKEKYPNFNYVTEVARDCPFALNEKTGMQSQEWILRNQISREVAYPFTEVVISDRSTYDQLAYVSYAYDNGNLTTEEYEFLEKLIFHWGMCQYEHFFYFPIEFPIELDGLRSDDEDYRSEIDMRILEIMRSYIEPEFVTTVSGTVEQRMKIVEDKLFELAEKNPLLKR